MEQSLQNQISGSINPEAILKVLPTKEKPKRNSYKKATRIVKNSVKGKTSKITKEQGFRNYLQYTDPLLLNNNELDQSDLANSLSKILNLFVPDKMGTEKIQEVKNFVATQTPVDANDIKTEVIPDRNLLRDAAEKRANKKQNEYKDIVKEASKAGQERLDRIQNSAATKIQKVARGSKIRQIFNDYKAELDKSPVKKRIAYMETGTIQDPLIVLQSPAKTRNYKKQNEAASKIQQFMKENTSKPSRKDATRQRGRPVGSKNRTPEEIQQDVLNKMYGLTLVKSKKSKKSKND